MNLKKLFLLYKLYREVKKMNLVIILPVLKRIGRVALAGAIVGALTNLLGVFGSNPQVQLVMQICGTALLASLGKLIRAKFGEDLKIPIPF